MTAIYAERAILEKLRRTQVCFECGERLWLYLDVKTSKEYLSCSNQNHSGLKREYQQARELNIKTVKEELEKNMSTEKANAIVKYTGKMELARAEAQEIIESLYPEAPPIEQKRAILTCVSYRLNPLNKHVFLIPYRNTEKGTVDWSLVMGIKAKRLLANRPVPGTKEPRPFSYIDDTPRVMSTDEQTRIFGQSYTDRLMVIVKLQDPKTGATVVGYGIWRNADKVKGENKGNTAFNMASIRAESQALDRLRPGEMPETIEVVDENIVETEYRSIGDKTVKVATGEIVPRNDDDLWGDDAEVPPESVQKATRASETTTPAQSSDTPKRDPETLQNLGDLMTACYRDFKLSRQETLKELGVTRVEDLTETPSECYIRIRAVRKGKTETVQKSS